MKPQNQPALDRKPRGDSVLKTLPEPRQREIAEHAQAHTLAETAAWLAKDGLKVSGYQLSTFLSWWRSRQFFGANEATAEAIKEQIAREVQGLSDAELDELGQKAFSLLAIREENLDGFVKVRTAVSKAKFEALKVEIRQAAEARLREKAKLDREKFEFDASAECLKRLPDLKAVSDAPRLTPEEKQAAIREILFPKATTK